MVLRSHRFFALIVAWSVVAACNAGLEGTVKPVTAQRSGRALASPGVGLATPLPSASALLASSLPVVEASKALWTPQPAVLSAFAGSAPRAIVIRDVMGMVGDQQGNLYLIDIQNRRVMRLQPDGTRTTFAGGASADVQNDPLQAPFGIASDASGDFYVTETMNSKVLKIDTTGRITQLADGTTTGGVLKWPFGIAVDGQGSVFVANWFDHRIVKIAADGAASVFAGSTEGSDDGPGAVARFRKPRDLVCDSSGNLFVADSGNDLIRKITPDGVVSTWAGSTSGWADGTGQAAQFAGITGLAIGKDDTLYVVDAGNQRIRKISTNATVSTLAGSTKGFQDGLGAEAQFSFAYGDGLVSLTGITVDQQNVVWVTDTLNAVLRSISPLGEVKTLNAPRAGYVNGTRAVAQFDRPAGIAVLADGTVYVADHGNHRIRLVASTGMVTLVAGSAAGMVDQTGKLAQFHSPAGLVRDAASTLYVCDTDNHRIRKISPEGVVTTLAGSIAGFADAVASAAQFNHPRGLAIDSNGVLYVADMDNHRIRKVTPDGTVSTLAGGENGYRDGAAGIAQFSAPQALAVDGAGNLFVADSGNHRIRKIAADGTVTTVAGSLAGFADGVGQTARFDSPRGIAVDSEGVVYVADTRNHRIRVISPEGAVFTLVGSEVGEAFGAGVAARLNTPSDLCLAADGRLFVSDQGNHCIRVVELGTPKASAAPSLQPVSNLETGTPVPDASIVIPTSPSPRL